MVAQTTKEGIFLVKGLKVSNETRYVTFDYNEELKASERLNFKNEDNVSLSFKAFRKALNAGNEITVNAASPCSSHDDADFDSYFKREWDEFCDGFAVCAFQAVNPITTALMIAAHCGDTPKNLNYEKLK